MRHALNAFAPQQSHTPSRDSSKIAPARVVARRPHDYDGKATGPFATNASGTRLAARTRESFAGRFGHAVSRVSVHANERAMPSVEAANSRSPDKNDSLRGQGGNKYEEEADRVAERVMAMQEPQSEATPHVRDRRDNSSTTKLPARESGGSFEPPAHSCGALPSPGRPLDTTVRAFMEARFNHDFSHVQIHTDYGAERSAHNLKARAFTVGSHIVFGTGEYSRETSEGRRLLAHELAHTIQQRSSSQSSSIRGRSGQADAASFGRSTEPNQLGIRLSHAPLSVIRKEKSHGSTLTARPIRVRTYGGAFEVLPAGTSVGYTEDTSGTSYTIYFVVRAGRGGSQSQIHRSWLGTLTGGAAPFFYNDPEDVSAEKEGDSLEELRGNPDYAFLFWDPDDEQTKSEREEEKAAEEQKNRIADVGTLSAKEIIEQWDSRQADLLAVAVDPDNRLTGLQMHAIWVSYWTREESAAYAAMDRIETKVRAELGPAEFSNREYEFHDLGKRDVYGPEYQAAFERKAAIAFMFTNGAEVRSWLEEKIDLLGNRVTFEDVNKQAYEIASAKKDFQTYFAPLILGALAMASTPKVGRTAPVTGTGTATTRIRPVNGRVNVGGGVESGSQTATNLNPIKPGSGGPARGIPNHVKAPFEEIGEVFEPGSVRHLFSNRLRFVDVNWTQAANGAATVMPTGGTVMLNLWTHSAAEAATVVDAFRAAGFSNVATSGSGSGTIVTAVR